MFYDLFLPLLIPVEAIACRAVLGASEPQKPLTLDGVVLSEVLGGKSNELFV